MKKLLILTFLLAVQLLTNAQNKDTRVYEMRIYWPHEGKMADMQARFRNHTTKLFEKHGMMNIGYFVPQDKPDSVLVYILAYPSQAARDTSWKRFGSDPEWKKVASESEKNGKLVKKVEQKFFTTTDFSPLDLTNEGNRVFELRTYTASKYNLGLLMARFRNHTLKLFEKQGMRNIIYWNQVGKDDQLIYFLSHKSREAAKASFDAFRLDPEWIEARVASEKLAKGSITSSVISAFFVPTDFSTLK